MNESVQNAVATITTEVIDPLVTLLFVVALAYFIFGVIKFIANADDQEDRSDGKRHLLYSVIGLVIMAGVWGILQLIINSIGIPADQIPDYPQLN